MSILTFIFQSCTNKHFMQMENHTDCSSVKSISGVNVVGKCTWLVGWYIWFVWCIVFLSPHWLQHFLTSLLVLSNSKYLIVLIPSYPFPVLNWVAKFSLNWSTVSHVDVVKQCTPQNNKFGKHMTILLAKINEFDRYTVNLSQKHRKSQFQQII